MTKSKKWIHAKKAETSKVKNLGQSNTFLIANARKAFTKLRQAFVEAPILNHFDFKRYISIKINALDYAIGKILSQLTSNNLG